MGIFRKSWTLFRVDRSCAVSMVVRVPRMPVRQERDVDLAVKAKVCRMNVLRPGQVRYSSWASWMEP